jgi:hypothetical protein
MLGLGLVGLPLGGFLYEVYLSVPFLMDVLFFALASLFALFVQDPVKAPLAGVVPAGRPKLVAGTGPVTVTALLASLARSAVLGVLVLFALADLGLGAPAFGLLLAGLAAATAAGGWVAPDAGGTLGLKAGFAVAAVLSGVALVVAGRVADPVSPWKSVIALGVAWATATTATVLLRALLPVAAGRPVTGAGLRLFHVVEWGGICVGAVAGGWLARRTGVADVLTWAAGAWAVAALAVTTVRRRATVATEDRSSVNWLDAA